MTQVELVHSGARSRRGIHANPGPLEPAMRRAIRVVATIILAILVVLLAAGCQQPLSKSAGSHHQNWDQVRGRIQYQVALQQYNAGRPEETARTALQAVALNPKDAQAYVLLCRSRIEIADWGGASDALSAARDAGIDDPMLVYLEGVLDEQRGDAEGALVAYQRARQRQPDNPDFVEAEAEVLVLRGAPDAALDLVRPFVGRSGSDATLDTLAARLAVLIGDAPLADSAYRSAIRKTDHALVTLDYANFLMERKRFDEARALLEPLTVTSASAPLHGCIVRSLARCQLATGDPASAFRLLEPCVRAKPDDDEAQLLFATAAVLENRDHAALRATHAVLDHNPRQTDALLIQAIVHERLGQMDAARETLRLLLDSNPSDPAAIHLAQVWSFTQSPAPSVLADDR